MLGGVGNMRAWREEAVAAERKPPSAPITTLIFANNNYVMMVFLPEMTINA